ncbi:helix-turn-helix transcriptional regulator [Chishuiella sp.]|uniref:S24 family peptidase n=1 Tax=Chishuiella sp. TaxID=1969467 RepID=UPI0028A67443|nr:S24 family peptidase [Chishuiella sp.]
MIEKDNTINNSKNITERIINIVEYIKFTYKIKTNTALAKIIEVPQPNLSAILNGVEKYQTEGFFNKIIDKYPIINKNWIETGQGNMLNDQTEAEEIEVEEVEKLPIKKIPFFDVDFYSGFTKIFNDQTVAPSYYFYLPEFHNAQFAIKNSGKSMSKELGNDDILGLREVPEWKTYFPQGEIYAVVTTNDLRTIKKVRRDKENKNLVLIPKPLDEDKFDYPDYEEVPISMVTALFQVVASTHSKKLAL